MILPVGQLSFKIAHNAHLLEHFIHELRFEIVIPFLSGMIFGYVIIEIMTIIGKKVNHRNTIVIEVILLFSNATLLSQCEEKDVVFCFFAFLIHFVLFELMSKILFSSYRCLLLAFIIILMFTF